MTSAQAQRLTAAVEPVVRQSGFDLEQLSVARVGDRTVVRVVVDRDGGVDLDAVAEVSRLVSATLDDAGGPASAYTLEVSSPGADRSLTAPRHWRRSVGRLVRVNGPDLAVCGRVVEADEAGVLLDVDGAARRVDFDRVRSARVEVEFTKP